MIRLKKELTVVRTLRLLREYDREFNETPWYRFIKRKKISEKHDELMTKFLFYATNCYLESIGIEDKFVY